MSASALKGLIDEALAEQQDMRAVLEFSRFHDRLHGEPALKKHYSTLIPSKSPLGNQQYAFEVNLDACTGCKACVAGCNSMNGLDADESFRQVGLITALAEDKTPILQHVTSSCHHCLNPECLNGCPVQAYEKQEDTGIVKHLDDQCMGCHYCELKCPYGAPQYNKRLGIVRKCDMCVDRLTHGEAPACVQSCPNSAIRIRTVDKDDVAEQSKQLLAAVDSAPDASVTLPTSNYVSHLFSRPSTTTPRLRPDHDHLPLALMLTFTQAGVGAFGWLAISPATQPMPGAAIVPFCVLLLGLAVAPLHLGRPLRAWRAFLGWRTSWLSREILAFGPLPLLAGAATLPFILPWISSALPQTLVTGASVISDYHILIAWATFLYGLGCVFASTMIYVDTPRVLWKSPWTFVSFYTSTLVGGMALLFICGHNEIIWPLVPALALKLASEYYFLAARNHPDLLASSALIKGLLFNQVIIRLALLTVGCVTALTLKSSSNIFQGALACVCLIAGEVQARRLFFMASKAPSMPKNLE